MRTERKPCSICKDLLAILCMFCASSMQVEAMKEENKRCAEVARSDEVLPKSPDECYAKCNERIAKAIEEK